MYADIPFKHKGRSLTVRARLVDQCWQVAVYDRKSGEEVIYDDDNGNRLIPRPYRVCEEARQDTRQDAENNGVAIDDPVKELMNTARSDIENDVYPLRP